MLFIFFFLIPQHSAVKVWLIRRTTDVGRRNVQVWATVNSVAARHGPYSHKMVLFVKEIHHRYSGDRIWKGFNANLHFTISCLINKEKKHTEEPEMLVGMGFLPRSLHSVSAREAGPGHRGSDPRLPHGEETGSDHCPQPLSDGIDSVKKLLWLQQDYFPSQVLLRVSKVVKTGFLISLHFVSSRGRCKLITHLTAVGAR